MTKEAELTNTDTMPAEEADKEPESTKAVVNKKTAATGHLVPGHAGGAVDPGTNIDVSKGKHPGKLPQSHILKPHVDVAGFEPPKRIQEKKANVYALRDRYPLDNLEQVKMASAYFDEFGKRMPPEDRHEYCVNMVKRAEQLSIPVSDDARKYGSEGYAPADEIKQALDARRTLLEDKKLISALDKLAFIRGQLEPEMFCLTLTEFDKTAGLEFFYDRDVPDPFYSTYGFEKKATFSEVIGNIHVTESDLEYLAMKRLPLVKGTFSEDMATEFRKDPVGIFKSLPLAQRKILANMAREQHSGAPGSG
jgi:hypothetical protein